MFCNFLFHLLFFASVYAKVNFKEEFSNDNWTQKWISSDHSCKKWGKFILSPGKYSADPAISRGIQTSENAKFYGISTKFEPFSNEGKVLVVQFSVRHTQRIYCGGGYIKLFDCNLKPKMLHSYTPYLIMFGPDICGSEKKVQVIFNYQERRLVMKGKIDFKDDHLTHLYSLIVNPDNTYIVKIDNEVVRKGRLEEDWEFLPPRALKDLSASNSRKLAVDNKEHVESPDFYKYDEICGVGFDLWQVKAGSIFDNILITDDELEAEKHGEDTWGAIKEKEKAMKGILHKAAADEDVINITEDSSSKTKITHDEF